MHHKTGALFCPNDKVNALNWQTKNCFGKLELICLRHHLTRTVSEVRLGEHDVRC